MRYPSAVPEIRDLPNPDAPTFGYDRRCTTASIDIVPEFVRLGPRDFSRPSAEHVAGPGDGLTRHYGSLHMALCAAQEPKMCAKQSLAHLQFDVDSLPPPPKRTILMMRIRRGSSAVRRFLAYVAVISGLFLSEYIDLTCGPPRSEYSAVISDPLNYMDMPRPRVGSSPSTSM